MIELTSNVKDFELTTGVFLKHYCSLGLKCFYDVIENTWDGKLYKDLILYISTPNSKDMYKANVARQTIIDELTDTDNCYMGIYANYHANYDMMKDRTVIILRKYNDDKELY